ncbi:WD40 repeat domain-containing protein, partial [Scytonema sp. PCC 10023]|uniref:WD40 repeat domain-containing protein n=1 Tax=Scytonema sp. PCC 10023 TaxID=1680591 RepID=UPI0039C67E00
DGTVRLWSSKGQPLAVLNGHQGFVLSVAIGIDKQRIVSGGSDNTVRLWSGKGQPLAVLNGEQGSVKSVAISTDKQTIVSGGS